MGLALSILVGPILFALVQTSLDRGVKSGLIVGLGIWMSDMLFITAIFWGFAYIQNVIALPNFEFFGGTIGGVILIAIGIGMLLNNKIDRTFAPKSRKEKAKDGIGLWLKGFLINTVNPFTVFFWMGIVSTRLGGSSLRFADEGLFFIGLLGTVIIMDALKIMLAGRVRDALTDNLILRLRKITGIVLLIFGVVLIFRVTF